MGTLEFGLLRTNTPLIMILDQEGRILFWNHACSELSGYVFDEVRGKYAWDVLAAHDQPEAASQAYHQLIAGDSAARSEGYLVTKSGDRRWIVWAYDVIRANNAIEFVTAVGIDRTDAKHTEEALRVSEAKLAGIVSTSVDAIISVDEDQRIVLYNEGAEQIFGWSRNEALGKPLDMLLPERFRAVHQSHIRRFGDGPVTARRMGERGVAIFGRRKSGAEFLADAAISKIQVDGTRFYAVVLRDVSAQKRIERDHAFLSETGAIFATTLDQSEMLSRVGAAAVQFFADCCVIDLVDEDGVLRRTKVIHADPTKQELARRLERMPVDLKQPSLASAVLATSKPMLTAEVTRQFVESIAQSADQLEALRELDPGSVLSLPLLARGLLLGALILVRRSSSTRYVPDDVKLGEALAYRVANSLAGARSYRFAQQAIGARDHVLGVVAHDLRTPLQTAALAASMLLIDRKPNDDRRQSQKLAERIVRALERANRLIKDLLDVSAIEAGRLRTECAPVRADELVDEAVDAYTAAASSASLEIEGDLRRPLPCVRADRGRLSEVFSNLIGNALKFTPAGGRIMVGAEAQGSEVLFWVTDTGLGIASDDVPHLFDLFWQGQSSDRRGYGMGLHIAHAIVAAHSGRLWVDSTRGVGTTFYFTIPLAAGAEEVMASRSSPS